MSKTAIILVTYNGWSLTEACLNDIFSQISSDKFIVGIADNQSSDETVQNIRKNFPQVHIYPQIKNRGFGSANNACINGLLAEGFEFDSICLLNNDTRLAPGTLSNYQKAFLDIKKQFCNVILAPSIKNLDGTPQNNFFAGLGFEGIGAIQFLLNAFRDVKSAARILEGTPKPFYLNDDDQDSKSTNYHETFWTSAVCWMISTELWKKAGGFDEKIFMYYEDADLALRFRKLGARFIIANNISITHLGGGSALGNLSRAIQHDNAQQYVFSKHFGIRGIILSKSFRTFRSLARIAVSLPSSLIPGQKGKEKRTYLKHHFILLKEAIL